MLIRCIHFINQSSVKNFLIVHANQATAMNSCYVSFPFHTTVYDNLKCASRLYFLVNFASGSLLFQRRKGGVILCGII